MVGRNGTRWTLAAVLTGSLLAVENAAMSQERNCGPRHAVLAQLAENYQEATVDVLPIGARVAAELCASPAGTWTLLLIYPSGRACVAATGDGWEPPITIKGRAI